MSDRSTAQTRVYLHLCENEGLKITQSHKPTHLCEYRGTSKLITYKIQKHKAIAAQIRRYQHLYHNGVSKMTQIHTPSYLRKYRGFQIYYMCIKYK